MLYTDCTIHNPLRNTESDATMSHRVRAKERVEGRELPKLPKCVIPQQSASLSGSSIREPTLAAVLAESQFP